MANELDVKTVRAAYRLFLGREPETEAAVQSALSYNSLDNLRSAFLSSEEFQSYARAHLPRPTVPPRYPRVPLDVPPAEIETEVDADVATWLVSHVQDVWTQLGHDKPHWSVLSSDQFLPNHINESEEAFYASGAEDVRQLAAILERNGCLIGKLPHVLEYGCGMGRVTLHLARIFKQVTACDISSSHLRYAVDVTAAAGTSNVDYKLIDVPDFGMSDNFDVWFSRIVLQHNPPPIMVMILRRAFERLAAGGVAVFQVPTYALGYRFTMADYLSGQGRGQGDGIEMHVLPQLKIFELAREAGCIPLEVREDESVGLPSAWVSSVFAFKKCGQ